MEILFVGCRHGPEHCGHGPLGRGHQVDMARQLWLQCGGHGLQCCRHGPEHTVDTAYFAGSRDGCSDFDIIRYRYREESKKTFHLLLLPEIEIA